MRSDYAFLSDFLSDPLPARGRGRRNDPWNKWGGGGGTPGQASPPRVDMPNTPRSLLQRDDSDAQTVANAQPASRGTDPVEQDYTGGLLTRLREDNDMPPIPMRVDYDPSSTHPPAPRNQMRSDYQQRIDAMGKRLDEITGLLGTSHTDSGTRRLQNEFNALRTRMADIQAMNTEAKEPDPYMNVGNGVVFDRIRREYVPNPYAQQKQAKLETTTTPSGAVFALSQDDSGNPVAKPIMRPSNTLPGEDSPRQASMPLVEDVKGGFTGAMEQAAKEEAKLANEKDMARFKAGIDASKGDVKESVGPDGNPILVRVVGGKATQITTDDGKPVVVPPKGTSRSGGPKSSVDPDKNSRDNLTKQVNEINRLLTRLTTGKQPFSPEEKASRQELVKGLQSQLKTAQESLAKLGQSQPQAGGAPAAAPKGEPASIGGVKGMRYPDPNNPGKWKFVPGATQ